MILSCETIAMAGVPAGKYLLRWEAGVDFRLSTTVFLELGSLSMEGLRRLAPPALRRTLLSRPLRA